MNMTKLFCYLRFYLSYFPKLKLLYIRHQLVNQPTMNSKPQKIGLITATSLVVGNMIGVGIFVLPSALSKYGSISLLGWVFTSIGALILAKIFSNLSKIVTKSGGPYAYPKEAFGDFIGFLMAWGYWVSCWVGNAALAIGIVGGLSFFFPVLETNNVYLVIIALSLLWLFTWINTRGIKESGRVQVVTTILKLSPLVFVIIVGLFFFKFENFPAFNLTAESNIATIPAVAALTLYAFLGLECATIPAGNIKNPEKTIPKATMIGTLLTAVVYIAGTVVLFGILPLDRLQVSGAPFAEAARLIAGDFGGYFVAFGVVVSGIGVLNGWVLVTGQIPMATANDGLFPKLFKKENKNGAPVLGLIIGSLLTTGVMMLNLKEGLVDQFTFIVDIVVFVAVVPYMFTAAAYVLIKIERKTHMNSWVKTFVLGGLGFLYALWAIFGSGPDIVFYGFLMLIAGIPFYVLMRYNKKRKE
ncbi:amino acid/polyamine/organocation transporter (APC superfamily) [Flavobacteriaceae bacterium MAR_2010_72]|nr:amino acid/polyamine/organocation transporter (APC superfamily) [Flavobacteriaceae bacterium MAR_2010_72]